MKQVTSIITTIVFLCTSCFQVTKNSPRFTEEQITQLGLDGVQPLIVLNENSLTIDLEDFMSDRTLPVDELVDSISYIPLQTTSESLIAEVNKLICAENLFFVFDLDIGRNVLIFREDGSFVKKISTGQGPEEIYNPGDIAVDEEQNHLIVYDRKGLSFYDYSGNFIKRELLPFNFKNFRILPNGYLFVTVPNQNNHIKEFAEMQVLITDKNFRIISAGFPFHYSSTLNYAITDYTNSFGGKVNFAFKFSNKIYQYIDTLSVQEKYQLNFAKKELPKEYLEMNTREVLDILKNTNYYYFMGDFVENNTHEYFAIYNDYNRKAYQTFIFRDKLSGKLKGGNKVLLDGNIPLFGFPLTSCKNELIGVISSSSVNNYLSNIKKGKEAHSAFANIDDDANPVLVKYKLKKFD